MPNRRIWTFALLASLPCVPTSFAVGINSYAKTNLVSDQPGMALVTDPLLVNPWGVAISLRPPYNFVVSNEASIEVTLYQEDSGSAFTKDLFPMNVYLRAATGVVANPSANFSIGFGHNAVPSHFIWASLAGEINGWNPDARVGPFVAASHPGHVYTGLAVGINGTSYFLYAADSANKKIDVYTHGFQPTTLAGTFTDPTIPASYSPHNIQNIGGVLYVAYARVNPSTGVAVPGLGDGYVSKFDPNGNFLGRLISNDLLNAPWGLAMAPASFGLFGGSLLVGNFGDGRINAFNASTGAFLGRLNDPQSNSIVIDGLRALVFGNGFGGDPNSLYFASGPNAGKHGLFGKLTAAAAPAIVATATTINPTEGVAFSGVVGAFADSSPGGTYIATINWDDNTSSPGVVTSTGSGGFLVIGTHTYGDAQASLPIGVTFTNTTAVSSATAASNAVVTDEPLAGPPVAFTATAGVPFTGIVATFIDVDAKATDFIPVIDWGDERIPVQDAGVVSGVGHFTVTSGHTYPHSGTFPVTVVINEIVNNSFRAKLFITSTASVLQSSADALIPALSPGALLALAAALAALALLMMRK